MPRADAADAPWRQAKLPPGARMMVRQRRTAGELLRWSAALLTAAAAAILFVFRIRRHTFSPARVAAFIVTLAIAVISLTTGAIVSDAGHAPMPQNNGRNS